MLNIKLRGRSTISFKLASQLAAEMSTTLLSQVYAQVSPDIVGNERRDLEIATEYGKRLESVSRNTNSHTVDHLVKHYPSHDFIIDDDEAKLWFHNVEYPSNELYLLVALMGDDALAEANPAVIMALHDCEDEDQVDSNDDHEDGSDGGNGEDKEIEGSAASTSDTGEAAVDVGGNGNRAGPASSAGESKPRRRGGKNASINNAGDVSEDREGGSPAPEGGPARE